MHGVEQQVEQHTVRIRSRHVAVAIGRRSQAGFLLLTVMVVIVIAGLLLAATARHSLALAVDAADRARDLQVRWGAESCREVILRSAVDIFGDAENGLADGSRIGTGTVEADFILGGRRFHLLLSDEDARVNLNTIYHYDGELAVRQYLRQAWHGVPIRLLPEVDSQKLLDQDLDDRNDEGPSPAFRSWGQVAEIGGRSSLTSMLPNFTSETTCWGSGRLNVSRASDDSIRRLAGLVLSRSQADRLAKELRKLPGRPLELLYDELGIDQNDQFVLQELLAEGSMSYGLWVIVGNDRIQSRQLSTLEQTEVIDNEGSRKVVTRAQTFMF